MLCYTVYTLLVAGLASQTLAEPVREPYQPKLARMSTRNILGLHRRGVEGYAPMEQLCSVGDTCAEACGKGFKQCASKDGVAHCYNPLKKQTCCPGGSGDSCDNGYFCTADEKKETWCCPDGLSLKECAQKYNIPGPLTSQAPPTPTTTIITTKSSTTTKASTTKSTSTAEAEASTTSATNTKSSKSESTESTTTKSKPDETSAATSSVSTTTLLIDVSNAVTSTEAVATQTTPLDSTSSSTLPASASTSSVNENGSSNYGPSHGFVLFIAGVLAALA